MRSRKRHAMVIGNGEMPPKKLLAPLLASASYIICADGGANKARLLKIRPDCIIGDLDSITNATLRHFSSVPVIRRPDQNSTDLEKALDFLLLQKFTDATVIGATGDRSDHSLSNFSILLKFHTKLSLRFFDEHCTAEIIKTSVRFPAVIGQQISLIPMGKCTGVTTRGLKFPLRNESLALGVREGSSNEVVARNISVTVRRGALLLFKIHPHIKH